jgi:hypothetical protein
VGRRLPTLFTANGSAAVPTFPSVDESLDRLHRAGWSLGDTAFGPDHVLVWVVTGTNGENRVEALVAPARL